MNSASTRFPVVDTGQVGEVRRYAGMLSAQQKFGETEAGKAGIIVTELANNLAKHAAFGEMVLRPIRHGEYRGIEMLALDKGPGMYDVARCMEDGFSTAGSSGTGLGAIARLAAEFDIYSQPGKGTAAMARIWAKGKPPLKDLRVESGVVCLPLAGESACGDGWALREEGSELQILVCDGLGHGPSAAKASEAAIGQFREFYQQTPHEMMQTTHRALLGTRGAAVALTAIDFSRGAMQFAGVGNIAGAIYAEGKNRGLASYNGTVGHQMHKMQELEYPWPQDALLVMHSDGLQSRWKMDDYPGLRKHHPALIAGVLYRDHQRGRDDVTVLAVKENRGGYARYAA